MQYTTLGKTGLQVSRLCFGTMSFGGDADESTSAHMYHRCREAGINFFDTANVYSQGKSEEILGTLIRGHRDDLVITSKVYGQMGSDRNRKGLSRRNIMLAIDESLRRLDTDRLDVYFCHMFDATVPMEETLRAMDDLVRQGKILYPGVSNWSAWQIAKGLGLAEWLKVSSVYVVQPMYNLVKRVAEIEILPLARDANLGVISYSPLGGGLLTGKYGTTQRYQEGRLARNKNYSIRYGDELYYKIAEDFTAYAKKTGIDPATLAVAWVKANPAITAPIIGARNLEQLEPSLAAGDYEMSPQQWQEIAALTPPVPIATDRTEEAKGLSVFQK